MALQNAKANTDTMKKWIETHTPLEVEVANNARRSLNRIAKEPKPAGSRNKLVAHSFYLLKDDRRLKRPSQPYINFVAERWASGDMKDVPLKDAAKSLAAEWKQLSDGRKQVCAFVDFNASERRVLTVCDRSILPTTRQPNHSTSRSTSKSTARSLVW